MRLSPKNKYIRVIRVPVRSVVRSLSIGFLTACSVYTFGTAAAEEEEEEDKIIYPLQDGRGTLYLTDEADPNPSTIYFQWDTDAIYKNTILKEVAPPKDATPDETENLISIKLKKEYGNPSSSQKEYLFWDTKWLGADSDADGGIPRRVLEHKESSLGSTLDENTASFIIYGTTNGTALKDTANNLFYQNKSLKTNYLSNNVTKYTGGVFIRNSADTNLEHPVSKVPQTISENTYYTWRPSKDNQTPEPGLSSLSSDSSTWGGLIVFNEGTTTKGKQIDEISGVFIGNYTKTKNAFRGGLIYNGFAGYIGKIGGDYIGNNFGYDDSVYAAGTSRTTQGGIVYNHSNATIGSITGNYIGNGIYIDLRNTDNRENAFSNNRDVIGGVIVNHGLIENGIHDAVFVGNYAYAYTTANSGVIRNYSANGYIGIIGKDDAGVSIDGTFIGNYTRAVMGDAYGGIMRNNGEVQGTIQGYYHGNYAMTTGNNINAHNVYTVDKQNAGEGHYMYDPSKPNESEAYILYETALQEANKTGATINKEDFYLKKEVLERYHTGERTGLAQGGVYYNTIKYDGTGGIAVMLSKIDAVFENNYVLSKWSEASGGVLYNQDATIQEITGSFTGNYALSLAHKARGGAIYNKLQLKAQTSIEDIGSRDEHVSFTGNYAQGRIAGGGAIYTSSYSKIGEIFGSFNYNYAKSELGIDAEEFNAEGNHFGDSITDYERELCDEYYEYRARGGALFVDNYAEVKDIHADFIGNYVRSDEPGAKVRGGAILVTTGGIIGHISGFSEGDEATFRDNYAWGAAHNEEMTFGGAIRFDNSVIQSLSADFTNNWTTGSGGAISLTESGFIYEVTGKFEGNQAGHLGGAVHNLGTIGYLGDIAIMGEDGSISYSHDLETVEDYEKAVRGKDNRIETRTDETTKRNKANYYEYDGSIRGGFVNTSFIGNKVDNVSIKVVEGEDGHYTLWDGSESTPYIEAETRQEGVRGFGAAIYTTDNLFITANDTDPTKTMVISGNQVTFMGDEGKINPNPDGSKTLNTALYVDSSKWTKDNPVAIYLVATKGSRMEIHDAIRGAETEGYGFVMRLRGYSEKYDYTANPDYLGGGSIYISGPVAQSYTIMDDVTLQIGRCVNYFSFGDADERHLKFLPGYIEDKSIYGRSDVFRKSHLSARSGLIDLTADGGEITQFIFDSLISYGNTWRYDEKGTNDLEIAQFYKDNDLYAQWAVDVYGNKDDNRGMGKADLITVISNIDTDDGGNFIVGTNKSEGRVTIEQLNIKGDGLDYTYKKGDNDDSISVPVADEHTFKVQILNIILQDKNGDMLTEEQYAKTKYMTSDSPLQLDNNLEITAWEHSDMRSNETLVKDIRLATTRTYHDSIEIIGWRDNLAAWAELTDNTADSRYNEAGSYWDAGTFDAKKKTFTLVGMGVHDLTRNVGDLTADDKWEESDGAVWGNEWTIRGERQDIRLNLNEKNLLTIVKDHQAARLEYFTLSGVREGKMLNEGNLTLDTMKVADRLTVNNRNTVTLQGYMTIDKSITITTDAVAAKAAGADTSEWKSLFINDETEVFKDAASEKTVLTITEGTIEKQDITHRGSALQSTAALTQGTADEQVLADANFTTVTNLFTTDDAGNATAGFSNFRQNSLTMEGGKFNLGNMGSEVLMLRGLHMKDGLIYVNSSTVDLQNATMGGIRSAENGQDNATHIGGVIWLDNMEIISDSKERVTHVQFVTSGVGDAVQDNIRNTTKKGKIWYYDVTYNDATQTDSQGETGQNGYYTFVRTDNATPEIQDGSVASLVDGYASMMQVYDFSFEHADLFSATMENTRSLRKSSAYAVVSPVKSYKDAAPSSSTSANGCPTHAAGQMSAMWVRPYATFEKLPLNNGPKVDTNLYGALIGTDTSLREHRSGWADVTSFYGIYMGATKRYEGIRSRQNGMGLGITETLYKGNFYTALAGSIGTSYGHTNTTDGTEKYHMLMAGVASRTGYSLTLGSCRYVLQPTLLMSYTFINTADYTNASGVRMESDPLQVLQLHPYVKAIMHSDSGWNPYITAGYVHNFMGKTKFRADGEKLPELSIDPYVEYGVGIQKTWYDKYTLYGQATGRNGGREGAEVSVGIRWVW